MGLCNSFRNCFRKLWLKTRDEKQRKAAVKEWSDQSILAHIAQYDKSAYVRTAAVEKLEDQSTLAHIAQHDDDDDDVHRFALKNWKINLYWPILLSMIKIKMFRGLLQMHIAQAKQRHPQTAGPVKICNGGCRMPGGIFSKS